MHDDPQETLERVRQAPFIYRSGIENARPEVSSELELDPPLATKTSSVKQAENNLFFGRGRAAQVAQICA
jgi:hypothetical protein